MFRLVGDSEIVPGDGGAHGVRRRLGDGDMETAETKVGRRNGEKEQFWRGLFAEHGASGKTVVEFCLEKGLNASSFYGWRRKLRSRDGGKTTEEGFVELVRGGGAGSAGVSIRVSERISVVIERGFDEATLKTVLCAVGA
jgi:transposase-like protein